MKKVVLSVGLLMIASSLLMGNSLSKNNVKSPEEQYAELTKKFLNGWNTWNYRSVFSHTLMPEAFTLNVGFKDYYNKDILNEAMLGFDEEDLVMGPHAYNGSYTMVELKNWSSEMGQQPLHFKIQSAHVGNDLVILIDPINPIRRLKKPLLVLQAGFMWNRPGNVEYSENKISAHAKNKSIDVYTTGKLVNEHYTGGGLSPYMAIEIDGKVGISTGKNRDIDEIMEAVKTQKNKWEEEKDSYGEMADVFDAIQTVIAWNVVYEPNHDRVICPVSRRWSKWNKGYALYCWDTYFAAYQAAATGSREVAYINLVEMTRAKHKAARPFVPNSELADGRVTKDRSQPPVGSLCALKVYQEFNEKWILELLYNDLLEWNEWWKEKRDYNGLLCVGSTPYKPALGVSGELEENDDVNGWFGASKESGWDGALIYQNVPFDKELHHSKHWDVSLNSLYVMDCISLANIADILGKTKKADELRNRATAYKANIQKLWNVEKRFFFNRNWETGEFSNITAINGFYPLIAGAATDEQAEALINHYFYNLEEFWGRWIIPTISRSHPIFFENEYWDGRIWPPVNFLIYLGLRNYAHLDIGMKAKKDLIDKSKDLLMLEWKTKRYVREDFNTITGKGKEENQYSRFYHWGGLLGLMSLIEGGYIDCNFEME